MACGRDAGAARGGVAPIAAAAAAHWTARAWFLASGAFGGCMPPRTFLAGFVVSLALLLLCVGDRAAAQDGGYLGVAFADVQPAEAAALGWPAPRGIKVTRVVEGTPADQAGLRVGDIILTVDRIDVMGAISRTVGDKTDFWNRLQAYLDLKRPGDAVEIV